MPLQTMMFFSVIYCVYLDVETYQRRILRRCLKEECLIEENVRLCRSISAVVSQFESIQKALGINQKMIQRMNLSKLMSIILKR
jgi:hypothetical protein